MGSHIDIGPIQVDSAPSAVERVEQSQLLRGADFGPIFPIRRSAPPNPRARAIGGQFDFGSIAIHPAAVIGNDDEINLTPEWMAGDHFRHRQASPQVSPLPVLPDQGWGNPDPGDGHQGAVGAIRGLVSAGETHALGIHQVASVVSANPGRRPSEAAPHRHDSVRANPDAIDGVNPTGSGISQRRSESFSESGVQELIRGAELDSPTQCVQDVPVLGKLKPVRKVLPLKRQRAFISGKLMHPRFQSPHAQADPDAQQDDAGCHRGRPREVWVFGPRHGHGPGAQSGRIFRVAFLRFAFLLGQRRGYSLNE